MDKSQLVNLLEQALSNIQVPSLQEDINGTGFEQSQKVPEIRTSDEAWQQILLFIRNCPELKIFDNLMLNTGDGGGCQVTHETLVKWLLYTANQVGSTETVDRLQKFLELDATPGYYILSLSGLKVKKSVKLSDSINLVPFEDVPDSDVKQFFEVLTQKQILQPPQLPHVALIHSIKISPKTFKDMEIPAPLSSNSEILHQISDCLTLVGPCAPKPVAEWTWFENWVPCSSLVARILPCPSFELLRNSHSYTFSEDDCSEAAYIVSKYLTLNPKTKQELRIPMQRLNQSIRRKLPVDKIIDLAIALEAVLVPDNPEQQLALSFRLHGAWLMGKDPNDRKNYADLLKQIYKSRCKAVHSGKVNDTVTRMNRNKQPISQLIQEGTLLCANILKVIIKQGEIPDWNALTLGDNTYKVKLTQ